MYRRYGIGVTELYVVERTVVYWGDCGASSNRRLVIQMRVASRNVRGEDGWHVALGARHIKLP